MRFKGCRLDADAAPTRGVGRWVLWEGGWVTLEGLGAWKVGESYGFLGAHEKMAGHFGVSRIGVFVVQRESQRTPAKKCARPGILQASTLKWRQQQAVREQRRLRARRFGVFGWGEGGGVGL